MRWSFYIHFVPLYHVPFVTSYPYVLEKMIDLPPCTIKTYHFVPSSTMTMSYHKSTNRIAHCSVDYIFGCIYNWITIYYTIKYCLFYVMNHRRIEECRPTWMRHIFFPSHDCLIILPDHISQSAKVQHINHFNLIFISTLSQWTPLILILHFYIIP